jgi:putative transposase
MLTAKEHPHFFTATNLNWEFVLADKRAKDIVVNSLRFLSKTQRARIFAFCLMSNHIHLIWQMLGNHRTQDVQRDFLKFTAQLILKFLTESKSPLVDKLLVNAKDRKYQVWERNSLSISIESDKFLFQKLEYIHQNPVAAGLCKYAADYHYSSAAFYFRNVSNFDFLVHYQG